MIDFDGTIADSLPAAIASIRAMLAELGYPKKTAAEVGRFIGFGEEALVAGSIGTNEPERVKEAQAVYYKHNLENIKQVKLYPHVRNFLKLFEDKTKIVISNKRDEFIRLILDKHHLIPFFTEIIGGDTSPCLKPDPCAINEALKKYKVRPEHALYIGDMTVDVETGRDAHVLTCAVTYGFHDLEKLEKAKPDFLVRDLMELRELIF